MNSSTMPISQQKPWVRVAWLILGLLSLVSSFGFMYAAYRGKVPVSWSYAGLAATALWFAFGWLPKPMMGSLSCLLICVAIGITASGTGAVVAFAFAAFFALRLLKTIFQPAD